LIALTQIGEIRFAKLPEWMVGESQRFRAAVALLR
jgi:hypothetical protein